MKDLSWINDLPESMQNALFEGSALRPPDGVLSNFTNPSNKNSLVAGVLITCLILSGTLVALRLYSRLFYHRRVAIEDYAALIALACFSTYFYYSWRILRNYGLFVHQWNIRLRDLSSILHDLIAASIAYSFVLMPIKVGILIEWTKLFVPRDGRNRFWWICQITLVINVLFYVISTFLIIFGCSPRTKLWNLWEHGRCLDVPRTNIGSSVINLFSDIIILLLPQRIIWDLQLSLSKRIGVAAVFAMGIFSSACAAYRIHTTIKFATADDIVYNLGEMCCVAAVEMATGFFVLCLPSLPKLASESLCLNTAKSKSTQWTHKMSRNAASSSNDTVTHLNVQPPTKSSERILLSDFNKSDTIPLTEPRISSHSSNV